MVLPPFRPGAWEKADLLAVSFSLSRATEAIDVVAFRPGVGDTSWCAAAMEQAASGLESLLGAVTPGHAEFDLDTDQRVEASLLFTTYEPGPQGLWSLVCDLRSVARIGTPMTGRQLPDVKVATARLRDALRRPLDRSPTAPPRHPGIL